MKLSANDRAEAIQNLFETGKKHFACAGDAVYKTKEGKDPLCNIALYHLSVCAKIALKMACLRFAVEYSENDSIDALFNKAGYLMPTCILKMENDMHYWFHDVQHENANVMTDDEVCAIGYELEKYFNDFSLVYALEIKNVTKGTATFWADIKPLEIF